jgi:hypothetical protein
VFAVRTFFWWANYFTISLQVSGECKKWLNEEKMLQVVAQNSQWWIALDNDPWQHDISTGSFKRCDELTQEEFEKHLRSHPFVKISQQFSLQQWNQLPELIGKGYESLVTLF